MAHKYCTGPGHIWHEYGMVLTFVCTYGISKLRIFAPHKRSCGKVMFSQVSVHGGVSLVPRPFWFHVFSGDWLSLVPGYFRRWVCPGGGFVWAWVWYASYWNAILFLVISPAQVLFLRRWFLGASNLITMFNSKVKPHENRDSINKLICTTNN